MKRVFRLEGLDCANCAAKIENGIKKLDGVTDASVSFLTLKLVIDGEDSKIDQICDAAQRVVASAGHRVTMKRV